MKNCVKWSLAVSALMMGVFSATAQDAPQKTTTTTTATVSSEPEKKGISLPPDSISEGTVSVEGGKAIAYRTVAGMLAVGSTDSQDARIGLDGSHCPTPAWSFPQSRKTVPQRPACSTPPTSPRMPTSARAPSSSSTTAARVRPPCICGWPASAPSAYSFPTSASRRRPLRNRIESLLPARRRRPRLHRRPRHRLQPCRGQRRLQSLLRHRRRCRRLPALHPPLSDQVRPLELAQLPLR